MIHYSDFVRLYNYPDSTDSKTPEITYKYIVKQPYDRTNKKNDFLNQIFLHNIHRVNIQAIQECYVLKTIKRITEIDQRLDNPIN